MAHDASAATRKTRALQKMFSFFFVGLLIIFFWFPFQSGTHLKANFKPFNVLKLFQK